MKKVFLVILALLFIGAGIDVTFDRSTSARSTVSGTRTYANSQVDTLRFLRPPGLAGAALSIAFGDSFKITNVIMRRIIDGQLLAVRAGDTIFVADSATAAGVRVGTLTLAPLVDEYRFFVTYGGDKNGVTSPSAEYAVQQQFYGR